MPVTNKIKNDTNTPVYCRIEDTSGNNPDIDKVLATAGLLLAALAFTAFVPAAPAVAAAGQTVSMLWKAAASTRVGQIAAGPGAEVAIWGFARAFMEPDSATVKTALLGPNQELSQEVERSNAILIARITTETLLIGSRSATFLVSRLTILRKTQTETINVAGLETSDSDVLFRVELPQPESGKSYSLYTANFLRFRNLAPPTPVESSNRTGGIWEVIKDSSITSSSPTVEGWVHQMVTISSEWRWSASAIYLEKGFPLPQKTVNSRYEIVTSGTLTCLKLTDFKVSILGDQRNGGGVPGLTGYDGTQAKALELIEANRPLPRIEATLMQLVADTTGPRYKWAYWHNGGSLFPIDNNGTLDAYIKYQQGDIVYLPATPEGSMIYTKLMVM